MAWPNSQSRRVALTIQNGQVSGTSHTDLPVLLTAACLPDEVLDSDNPTGTGPQSDGGDIRFATDEDGSTQIPFEIVSFTQNATPASANVEIWVKVPSVSGSVDTTIYMAWDTAGTTSAPAAGDANGRNAVWADYEAVWHLNQDSSVGTAGVVDSTGNGHDSTPSGTFSTADSPTGKGIDLTGDGANVSVPNPGPVFPSPFSIQAWLYRRTDPGNYPAIYADEDFDSNSGIYFGDKDAGTNSPISLRLNGGNGNNFVPGEASTTFNAWKHYCGTWDGDKIRFYKDGSYVVETNPTFTTVTNNTAAGAIGASSMNGIISELRIASFQSNSSILTTEYNNQNSPSTFIVDGTPEDVGGVGSDLVKVLSETMHLNESLVRSRALIRSRAEATNLSETIAAARAITRTNLETLNLNEDISSALGKVRISSEGLFLIESLASARGKVRVADESISLLEALANAIGKVRIADEVLQSQEVISRTRALARMRDEALQVNEEVQRLRVLVRQLAETAAVAEEQVRSRALARVSGEAVNLAEVLARSLGKVRSVDETVAALEVIQASLAAQILRVINETMHTLETHLFARGIAAVVNEAVHLAEVVSKTRALLRQIAEVEALAEGLSRVRALTRPVDELLVAEEVLVAARTMVRRVAEAEALQEVLVRPRTLIRRAAEVLGITEDPVRTLTELIAAILTATVSLRSRLSGTASTGTRLSGTVDVHREGNDG